MRGSILDALPSYHRFIAGKGTIEIGFPWLTVGAILALEQSVVRPQSRVIELGSGGSTIFFARRAAHVLSFETDSAFAPRVASALEAGGLADKVRLVCATLADQEAIIAAEPDASFDILLVDHADPNLRRHRIPVDRLPLAMVALPKLAHHGFLVVDNYTIHGMDRFNWRGWSVWRFDDMNYQGMGTLIARRRP